MPIARVPHRASVMWMVRCWLSRQPDQRITVDFPEPDGDRAHDSRSDFGLMLEHEFALRALADDF